MSWNILIVTKFITSLYTDNHPVVCIYRSMITHGITIYTTLNPSPRNIQTSSCFHSIGSKLISFPVIFHSLSNLCLLLFPYLPLNTEIHGNYPWYFDSLSCMVLDFPYWMGVDSSYFSSGKCPSGLSQLTGCWDTDSHPFLSCFHI